MMAASGATLAMGAVGLDATQAIAATAPDGEDGSGGEEEEEEDHPHRTRNYAIALAILLALLLLAGFFLARNLGYLGGNAAFNLPNVVGQPAAQATSTLQSDGLVVHKQNLPSNKTVGTVVSTDPAANALVSKGDTVTLKVAVPFPVQQIPVPQGITNTSLSTAESLLQSAGLQYQVVYKSNAAPNGTVLSANPQSGSNVNPGSIVVLTVSSGPADVSVPSVIGLSQSQAGATLGQAGLSVGSVSFEASTVYSSGQVIQSNPGPGTLVSPGTAVNLAVSTGAPPPTTSTTTSTSSTTTSTTTTTTTNPGGNGNGNGNLRGRNGPGF